MRTSTHPAAPAGRAARLLAIALPLLLAGCASTIISEPSEPSAGESEQSAYEAAIHDAAVFEPAEQRPLRPITSYPVAVVTWTSYGGYTLGENTLGKDVWVTLVPELQTLCRTFATDELVLRLQQLLGLPPVPPAQAYDKLVAMEVDAGEVFRPCTDPDPASPGPCTESFPADVAAGHVRWVADQMLGSYQVPNGYPWTRLGYTYDWNPAGPEFGLAEYVVRKGSNVVVTAIVPTAEYCQP